MDITSSYLHHNRDIFSLFIAKRYINPLPLSRRTFFSGTASNLLRVKGQRTRSEYRSSSERSMRPAGSSKASPSIAFSPLSFATEWTSSLHWKSSKVVQDLYSTRSPRGSKSSLECPVSRVSFSIPRLPSFSFSLPLPPPSSFSSRWCPGLRASPTSSKLCALLIFARLDALTRSLTLIYESRGEIVVAG